ncbi:MAG: hypothetical protein GF400_00960, partial [Candidatus Eisenbacteria bacterium]|nr:hypothetical protein [Candidatus Eisenbacteria bacterium]
MSQRKTLLTNIGANWVHMVVRAAGGLVLVPIIISRVGVESYGVWMLIAQALSYVTILNNGLMLAVSRLTAFHRDDVSEVNRFASASFWLLGAVGIVVVALSFV